jgi:hypothetical protein
MPMTDDAPEDAVEKSSQSTGAPILLSDAQQRAAEEWAADDRLWTTQETVAFNLQTFARVILKLARAEYDSGSEDCAICHRSTQNGVWGCDGCWDEIKVLAEEFIRLRRRAAFDQAHGLSERPDSDSVTGDAVNPLSSDHRSAAFAGNDSDPKPPSPAEAPVGQPKGKRFKYPRDSEDWALCHHGRRIACEECVAEEERENDAPR